MRILSPSRGLGRWMSWLMWQGSALGDGGGLWTALLWGMMWLGRQRVPAELVNVTADKACMYEPCCNYPVG